MKEQKRCAIYTRKSTDEGLDQDFNSLDAQRMAAENYIASQKNEGWICLPEHYDDGGFTGGNMERPALKKLLDEVAAGKVDIIVVYKVDRLSRSLMDFSRIIEVLDKSNASFVSVTQHFNTTDSMGRLTLNILLSFAQFEREIISERTRDKMSMQRKLGKFTGGRPILGYDTVPEGGAITVNSEEAEIVRQIFAIYIEQQSVLESVRIVRQNGWTNKRWKSRDGKMSGGSNFTTSTLYHLLTNPTYIGVVEYNGARYPGKHEAIIDEETFNRIQNLLAGNRGNLRKPVRSPEGAILGVKLKCAHCNATMSHTYTMRSGKKYTYYVCMSAKVNGWNSCPHPSVSAKEVEEFVLGQISVMLSDREFLADIGTAADEKNRQQLDGKLAREEILRKQHIEQSAILRDSISKLTVPQLANIQDDLAKIEIELKLLRQEITAIGANQIDQNCIEWYCRDFGKLWEKIPRVEQVKVIDLMIESLIFDAAKGTIKINYRDHGINAVYDYVTYKMER